MHKFKKAIYSWWWNATHVPIKPPKTLDLLNYHLNLLEEYFEGCLGDSKPLEIRNRYKASVADRKKRIEEIGFRAPKNLAELYELKGWIKGGNRYGQ